MTAQRLVRGSKTRIVAIVCAVVFCVGFLILFQKNQTQLDNVKKNYEMCVQQQESLSTQLQVIVDYKTRLEKSLQSEKAEHKQTRTELESRINDEKSRRDKTSMESNLRFQSLQQHYKLLQTKHDDLKEKSDKLQLEYVEEIDKLQVKVKELQEQFKRTEKSKEHSYEQLKTLYLKIQTDNEHLEDVIRTTKNDRAKWESELNHLTKINHQLQRELDSSKQRPKNEDTLFAPNNYEAERVATTRKFSKQVEVTSDVYQIRDNDNNPFENTEKRNDPSAQQVDAPNHQRDEPNNHGQNVVLQKPSNPSKSTTKTSSLANMGHARPLSQPTMTPPTRNNSKIERDINQNNVLPLPNYGHKKLPPGVVPVPKQELEKNDEQSKNDKPDDKNQIPDDINLALPNRYRNNIIESEMAKEIIKETKVEAKPQVNLQNEPEINMGLDINQQDNVAMEVMDQPKNLALDDPLNLMDAGLDTNDVKLQELDAGMKDPVVQLLDGNKFKKQHIDAMRMAADRGDNGVIRAPPGGGGLNYEAEGDYDKEGQKEDLQIEEQEPEGEEDDDGDDYDGHMAARQKDPAVRN